MKTYKVRTCPSCHKHTLAYRRSCIGCGVPLHGEPSEVESPDWAVAPKGFGVGVVVFTMAGTAIGWVVGAVGARAIIALETGGFEHGSPGMFLYMFIFGVVIPVIASIVLAAVGSWCGYVCAVKVWYGRSPGLTYGDGRRSADEPEPVGQNLADIHQTSAED